MKQTDLYNKHFSKTKQKKNKNKKKTQKTKPKQKSCSEMDSNLPYLKPATQAFPSANRKILLS